MAAAEPPAHNLLDECRLMLGFALREGRELPVELQADVAALDPILVRCGQLPLCDIPADLIGDPPDADEARGGAAAKQGSPGADRVLRIHCALSRAVAPATALSLRHSESREGGRWAALRGMPRVVRTVSGWAPVFALLFVSSAGAITKLPGHWLAGFWAMTNTFSGAALGACFYILMKTQPYLVNRSFDPKYNASYYARFITGTIGGVILATAIDSAFPDQLGSKSSVKFTPGILAILGGYAAEAVEQVLQRLVDVLLALVRGDGSAAAKAGAVAEQADHSADLRERLAELQAARGDEAKFKTVLAALQAALKKGSS
jgi:hypothetical protein